MRKTLLLFASVALLLVGCQKENFVEQLDGGMVNATFTASLESGVATRAVADGDGNGINVNRCIMEIYFQDQLYKRLEQPVTPASGETKAFATFSNVPVVAGKQYQILFWADCIDDATTEAGLATDKYYTTKTTTDNKGLKAVTVNKPNFIDALKSKKNDELDAFFFAELRTIPQNPTLPFNVTLKRPFAQLNVITTDVAAGKTVTSAALLPEKVSVSYEAANTINVATGETSKVGQEADYTFAYEAPVYGGTTDWPAVKSRGELTLSMDYILASTEQGLVNVTFITKNGDQAVMTHSLTNLPYQRNYRTNVKGDLLTTNGSWKAEIDPIWSEPAYNTVIPNSYLEALAAVATNNVNKVVITDNVVADYKDKRAQGAAGGNEYSQLPLSDTEKEALRFKETEDNKKYIMFVLKTTSPVTETFELPDPTAGGEENYGWYIYHEPQYPTQKLDVITTEPDMDVIIDAPLTHATVNGQEYNSVVSYTSPTTLVIPDNVAIKEKIEAKQGNILCFGTLKDGCNVVLAPAHDEYPASKFFYGIHSDVSADNYNTKRTYTPDVIEFMIAEGNVTDGTTISVVKESVVYGNGAQAYTAGGVNLFTSEKLSGQLKFDNQNKVTIKSGTFVNKLTFTTDKVYIENGDFNEVVAPEGAKKFIAGGIFTVKPLAKYVVLGYEATAVSTQAGTRYIITKVSSDYIVRITRGGEYLYATGNHLDLKGEFAYVMAYGSPVVQNGDYLELLQDLEGHKASSQISHTDGIMNWTLDLCGHSMTASASDDTFPDSGSSSASVLWAQGHGISGQNQITFTDSSSEGTGTIENTANDGKTFSSALSLCANNGRATKWIFEGGNYISKKDAIYYEKGDIVVNGGIFKGQNAIKGVCYGGSNTGYLRLTINGGQFDGNISLSNKTMTDPNDYQTAHATINGGIFNGDLVIGENVDLTISGGKFKTPSGSKYLAEGKYLNETNGYFVITDSTPASYVASLNGNTFFANDANDALKKAINKDVIELKANTTYVITVLEGEEYTILAEDGIDYAAPVAAEGFELVITDVTGGKKYSVPKIGTFKVINGSTVEYDGDDFKGALAKLGNGKTMKVMKDAIVTDSFYGSLQGTLDLNGHTIAFNLPNTGTTAFQCTNSSKTFTLTDSSAGKTGCMKTNTNWLLAKSNTSSSYFNISGGNYFCENGCLLNLQGVGNTSTITNSYFEGNSFKIASSYSSKVTIGKGTVIITKNGITGVTQISGTPTYTYKNAGVTSEPVTGDTLLELRVN